MRPRKAARMVGGWTRIVRVVVGLAMALGLATCGDSTEPAKPGWLSVSLETPNTDDGALLFTVGGGAIDSVRSSFSNVFASQVGEQSWRVIVAGALTSGKVAEIWVPDVSAKDYSATIQQIAARDTYEQRAATGYRLIITP